MTLLNEILNIEVLEKLIADRYITRKFHPDYPSLAILNYSPTAQYDSNLVWGREMNLCRGLIFDSSTMQVVARPFSKFWNLNDSRHPETLEENLPSDKPLITDKMDGSLGILFEWGGLNHVATRGSFISDQSKWATNWLRTHYPQLNLLRYHTILTEILYGENQIVLDYDFEGLVVLGGVNIRDGVELTRGSIKKYCISQGLEIVQEFKKSLSQCASEDITNKEGYVLTYSNGLKVKIKFSEYVRLHKIITGLNPRSIWELLRDGQNETIDKWLDDAKMPIDFKNWLAKWTTQLRSDFQTIYNSAGQIFSDRPNVKNRKDMAAYFLQDEHRKYSSILFGLLDGEDITARIWRMIEPKAADTFRVDGE